MLAWGCLLAPFEAAASGAPPAAEWSTLELSTLALAGAGLAAAAISALWAVRGQHLLMVAGWGVLLAGALVVDLVRSGEAAPADDAQASARMALDRIAYGLDRLDDSPRTPASMPGPGVPSLWSWPSIGRLVTADSQVLEAAAPTTIAAGGETVPVWLVVRAARSGQASVLAIADGRVGPAAAPLSYRAGDSLAYPGLVTYATLGRAAIHPGAPRLLVDSGPNGLAVGGLGRRVVLAWALQAPRLLGPSAPEARVRWHLGPRGRLERLAPFASWEAPRLLVLGGSFVMGRPRLPRERDLPWLDPDHGGVGHDRRARSGPARDGRRRDGRDHDLPPARRGAPDAQLGRHLTGRHPADGRTRRRRSP